jgi:PIN domain nuclease of toxin-antitoxin system
MVRFLLDTHVLVRWLYRPKRLSTDQTRVLRESVRKGEPLGISTTTLLEVAVLYGAGSPPGSVRACDILDKVEDDGVFELVPLTMDVAREVAAMGGYLRDPADRTIVATARVLNLRLLTSDERIIDSKLVPVIA